MNCPKCNGAAVEGAKFCRFCGYKFEEQGVGFCTKCGKKLVPGAAFCGGCGTAINAAPVQNVAEATPDVQETVAAPIAAEEEKTMAVFGEATVAEEIAPVVEETPAAEVAPVIEEIAPVMEETPAVEETPVAAEVAPVIEETPVVEEAAVVEEAPVMEETPAVEEVSVAEEAPAQPAEAEAVPQPIEIVAPVMPPAAKKGGAGRAILSIVLCLFVFIFAVAATLVTEVKVMVSPSGLEKAVKNVDILGIEVGDETLLEAMHNTLNAQVAGYDLDEDELRELIEESTLTDFFAEKTAGIVNDVLEGDVSVKVTKKEVEKLLKDNSDVFEDYGLELSAEDRAAIAQYMDDEGLLDSLRADMIATDTDDLADVGEIVTGGIIIAAILVLALFTALFILLIAAINGGKRTVSLTYGGVTLFITGIIVGLPNILAMIAPGMVSDLLDSFVSGKEADIVVDLITGLLSAGALVPIIVAAIGIVMVTIRIIVRAVSKKRAATAQ